VLVMIAGTTFLFGVLSLLMGLGQAGNLFRFLPYPVLGGSWRAAACCSPRAASP
jgi:MFS superfamily sulfate permease-like transporter